MTRGIKDLQRAVDVLDKLVNAGYAGHLVGYPALRSARIERGFRVEVQHDFSGEIADLQLIADATGTRVTVLSGKLWFVDAKDPS